MDHLYNQPSFYRFNEDSIKLARFASSEFKSSKSLIDLGAGTGIIGIEVTQSLKFVEEAHFLEVQEDFIEYLKLNITQALSAYKTEVFNDSWEFFDPKKTYDLILANPPYYLEGSFRVSKDDKRKRCRFISKKEMSSLFETAIRLMGEHSVFCCCLKNWELWEELILSLTSLKLFKKKKTEDDLFILAFKLNI